MMKKWTTKTLGENGGTYKLLIYSLPVMPIIIIVFAWYVLYDGNNFAPLFVFLFVTLVSAVLLHQWLEILNFVKTARVTAKDIYIKNNKIFLQLFSNKSVEISSNASIEDIGKYKIKPDRALFIKGMQHLAIKDGEQVFYISGTTQNFDELHKKITEIIIPQ